MYVPHNKLSKMYKYVILMNKPANISKWAIKTLEKCEICSKLTIKRLEQCQYRRSGIFLANLSIIHTLF